MTRFRRNHGRDSAGKSAVKMIRTALLSILLVALFLGLREFAGRDRAARTPAPDIENLKAAEPQNIFFLPGLLAGKLVKHQYIALSYVDSLRLPEWVAYELTSGRMLESRPAGFLRFLPDPALAGSPGLPAQGFGEWLPAQFAPSSELAFNPAALAETCFTSNVAPQAAGPSNRLWKRLEAKVRDWAMGSGHLYVVAGPVLRHPVETWAGPEKIAVPAAFYKVLLDLRGPVQRAIAFVIPNHLVGERGLEACVQSIDEVEVLTGLDFFPQLLEPGLEARLEASRNLAAWDAGIGAGAE